MREDQIAVQRRQKITLFWIVAILIASLLIGAAVAVHQRKEMTKALREAWQDYDFITHVAKENLNDVSEIREVITTRLNALTPYFKNIPTKQLGRDDLARLKRDNQEMLRSIGLLYSLSFPRFVQFLVKHGLNAEEIGLCSLYASGFVTKELSSMIDSGSIYHINSNIRTKLADQVEGRTLPSWLKDLLSQSA